MFFNKSIQLKIIAKFLVVAVCALWSPSMCQEKPGPNAGGNSVTGESDSVAPAAMQQKETGLTIPAGVLYGKFEKQDGPFLLTGSVIVPAQEVLEFGPGCVILVGGRYTTITVFGQLKALGTAAEPVVFQSANKDPNPWDWDRIYCRSKTRSLLEHCIIRHSNYGFFVENGSAKLDWCLFEKNSLHGLVVKNSDVTLFQCLFQKGQVLALLLESGAYVTADSLVLRDNITGIACNDNSFIKLTGGTISRNTNGIVCSKSAGISIVGADITRNKNGVIALVEVPKKMREMVYANVNDMVIAAENQMQKLLKPPEAVKSIVLPNVATVTTVREDARSGFSAMEAAVEPTGGFIGNVTTGVAVYAPTSLDTVMQSRYPGEQSTAWYSGIQPDVQVFANGRQGAANVNLLVDMSGNEWTNARKNMLQLSMDYAAQTFMFGDFYENHSETSISNRKMTGVRFTGQYVPMGRGAKRVNVFLAGGESEAPKDSGARELDQYNTSVDSGSSVRQQLTYVAGLTVRPMLTTSVSIMGIISRDQGNVSIFRPMITDPLAPKPIAAQTGCISATTTLMNGNLEVNAELDLGTHDTLADTGDINGITWYNPHIPTAIGDVFSQLSSTDRFSNHYALSFSAKGAIKGYDVSAGFAQIAPRYFAAGNPYFEADVRNVNLTADKIFNEQITSNVMYEYRRSAVSRVLNADSGISSPSDRNALTVSTGYIMGQALPELNVDYGLTLESSTEVGTDSASGQPTNAAYDKLLIKNQAGLECKQRFSNDIDYSVKYQLTRSNDLTTYFNQADNNKDDAWQHQISVRLGFKISRYFRNKTSVRVTIKDEVQNSLQSLGYKIGNTMNVTIIPRKVTFMLKNDYNNKADETVIVDSLTYAQSTSLSLLGAEAEVKYTITSKLAATIMGRYEKSLDNTVGAEAQNYTAKIGALHFTYLF